jgi:ribosomal protein S18 acetylase RimI-like enzyme
MSAQLEIRPFRESDASQVEALWTQVFPDDPPRNAPHLIIARKLTTQPELFLVGTMESRVVATALGGFDGHRGWVYHMAVDPDRRREGIGAAVLRDLEIRLSELGCPKLNLQVRSQNRDVIDFYTSLGYQVEERVSMGKPLAPS